MLWITIVWSLVVSIFTMSLQAACARLGDIYWNSSNPIFRIDNTDHIIDVNKGNIPFVYDQVNILCPVYNEGTDTGELERYIIYNVSKEEYDSCRITNPKPRTIAVCDKPHSSMYFTITFRSFTPQPGGLEFRPGQDYYFISTSSAESLDQKVGGKCATHNMKVIFKVCCSVAETTTTSTSSTTTSTTPPSSTSTPLTTLQYHFQRPSTLAPFRYPPYIITNKYTPPIKSFEYPREVDRGKTKKSDTRDRLPNQTRGKNEEWVNSTASKVVYHKGILIALLLMYHWFKIGI